MLVLHRDSSIFNVAGHMDETKDDAKNTQLQVLVVEACRTNTSEQRCLKTDPHSALEHFHGICDDLSVYEQD